MPARSAAVGGLSLALGVVDFGTRFASVGGQSLALGVVDFGTVGASSAQPSLLARFGGSAALCPTLPLKRPVERLQADGRVAPGLRQAGEGQGAQGGLRTSEVTAIIGRPAETADFSDLWCETAAGDRELTSADFSRGVLEPTLLALGDKLKLGPHRGPARGDAETLRCERLRGGS